MSVLASISRFQVYLTRNGLRATTQRIRLEIKRVLLANRMVLFYCDLTTIDLTTRVLPTGVAIERKIRSEDLDNGDLDEIVQFWNPKLARHHIEERFARGANLWLIRSGARLAGYGWTIQGQTVNSHYFPLGQNDTHLFDFLVFPEHRGQGLNPLLVGEILRNLASECHSRAFIEAAEWNVMQLSSLKKTPFCHLGVAIKLRVFDRTLVCWPDRRSMTLQ